MEGLQQHVQTESLRIHADGSDTYLNLYVGVCLLYSNRDNSDQPAQMRRQIRAFPILKLISNPVSRTKAQLQFLNIFTQPTVESLEFQPKTLLTKIECCFERL